MKNLIHYLRTRLQRSIVIIFILVVLTIAGFLKLILDNNTDARLRSRLVNETNIITRTFEDITTTLAENEAAADDYMLTGEPLLLREIKTSQERIQNLLAQGTELVTDSIQGTRLSMLATLIEKKVTFQQTVTNSALLNKGIRARISYNTQKGISDDAIKQAMGLLMNRQSVLLQQRVHDTEFANRRSQVTVFTGTAILFVFITLILVRLNVDMARRKKAEQDIRNSEKKYRLLIEDAGVTIFTSDFSGKFTYVSGKCRALTGYSSEELTGQSFAMLVEPDWVTVVADEYKDQVRKLWEETTIEFPIATKNGQTKWVEQHAVLIFDELKSPIGYQCIVRDITEKRNQEDKSRNTEAVSLANW
ncbi:MAG: PAS domain S-box protein [Sphingobacteriales bacterium]|nr:MAG: PAS domain S-box protein [Sphingobacteriales bacterium]